MWLSLVEVAFFTHDGAAAGGKQDGNLSGVRSADRRHALVCRHHDWRIHRGGGSALRDGACAELDIGQRARVIHNQDGKKRAGARRAGGDGDGTN